MMKKAGKGTLLLLVTVIALSLTSVVFAAVDVTFQGFEPGDAWSYTAYPTPYNVSGDVWGTVSSLSSITPSEGTTFWGMQDLENGNGGGAFDHTLTFDPVDVSSYSNAELMFDHNVIGFDSTDTMHYELFFDGVSQGQVYLVPPGQTAFTTNGWETITATIPNGTSTFSFTIATRQNGGSDYAGIDNVRLSIQPTDDIAVNKVGPAKILADNLIVYNIAVTAPISDDASNVVLTDTLPISVSYASDTSGVSPTNPSEGVYVWDLGDIPSNTVKSFALVANVSSAITSGTTITNLVEISADNPGDLSVNNADTALTTVYQKLTIGELRAKFAAGTIAPDTVVAIEGVATAPTGIFYAGGGYKKCYIQDATGGVQVRGANAVLPDTNLGDHLLLFGEVSEYFGDMQVQPQAVGDVTRTPGTPGDVPDPTLIGLDAMTETVEGLLIQTVGQVVNTSSAGNNDTFLAIADQYGNTGVVLVTDEAIADLSSIEVGSFYTITGVVAYEFSEYRLKPRQLSDFEATTPDGLLIRKEGPANVITGTRYTYNLIVQNYTGGTLNNLVITDTLPAADATLAEIMNGGVQVGDTISWTVASLADETEMIVSFAMTATGAVGNIIVNDQYAVTADEAPTYEGGVPVVQTTINDACDAGAIPIYDLQGNGSSSPEDGNPVIICGVVTGVAPGLSGFFMQDAAGDGDPATSDGVFVYRGWQPFAFLQPGDYVEVHGDVDEYYGVTQVYAGSSSTSELYLLANSRPLPAAVELDPPADRASADTYLETLEGMLVTGAPTVTVVGPTNGFGEYYFVPGDTGIERLVRSTNPPDGYRVGVNDGISGPHDFVVGDVLAGIYGPLHYTFSEYKVEQWVEPTVISETEIPMDLPTYGRPAATHFTMGAYNTLNFDGTSITGADYAAKLEKIVAAIKAMGPPTVFSLSEITAVDAYDYSGPVTLTGVITDVINALATTGHAYDYVYSHTDYGGHGVAVLYDTNQFTMTAWTTLQSCSPDGSGSTTNYDDFCQGTGELPLFSRRPVVITGTVALNGLDVDVTFIGAHFKSGFESDDIARRNQQAQLVADFAAGIQAAGQDYVALAGDLNDFMASTTITTLQTTGGLTNTFYTLPPEARYSYIYNGGAQVLDHILVSPALSTMLYDFQPLHMNADFPAGWEFDPMYIRGGSDHDPVIASFSHPFTMMPLIMRNYTP